MTRLSFSTRLLLQFGAALLLVALVPGEQGHAAAPKSVSYFEVTGPIDPATGRFIGKQLAESERNQDAAVVIRLDTKAGLEVNPQKLSGIVAASRVPVVVWIAPGSGQAYSLGAIVALSADVIAMAPGASLGRALPADVSKPTRRPTEDKALLADLLKGRSLSPGLPDLQTDLIDGRQAASLGIADFIARTVPELLNKMSGLEIADGATLPTGPFVPSFHKMPLLSRLLHAAVSPSSAYLLLFLGLAGLIFEIYNPGVGGGALSGGVMLMFSLYGFSVLPTNWLGLALVVFAFVLLLYDLQLSQLGPLSAGAGIAMIAGSVTMFRNASSLVLPWWMIAGAIAGAAAFFFGAMPAAIRARTAKPVSGSENLMGTMGVARTDISPDGQVLAGGTLWRARTLGAAIGEGSPVTVRGVAGLVLMVEQAHPKPAGEASTSVDL